MRNSITGGPRSATGVAVVVSQLGRGGAEKQTVELLRALRESPWRPRQVICLSDDLDPYGAVIQEFGYPIEVLPRAGNYDPRRLARLSAAISRNGVRLVHAVHLLASGYAFLASRRPGGPALVPSVRGTVVQPGPLRSFIYRRMFRACPTILVNSHRGAAFVAETFRVPPGHLRVIPNGIDFRGLRSHARGTDVRSSLGVSRSAPLIAYVGKNSPVKNVPRFLASWIRVSARVPDAHAVLVGGGLGEEGRAVFRGSFPEGRTHFLGPRDDVPALLAQSDVLLLTSNSEGTPNVVLESLAVGTPVVSTDVGDVSRMVQQGRTGIIAERGSATELAVAVEKVIAGGAEFKESIRNDIPRLEREYSLQAMVEGTVRLWEEVSNGVSPRAASV